MTIIKCDRCGKVIDKWGKRGNIVMKWNNSSVPAVMMADLCQNCVWEIEEFINKEVKK